MPDDCEIYMSFSVNFNKTEPVKSKITFGTGGETIIRNLYVGNIDMVLRNKLSEANLLDESLCKGFISTPAWVDLNDDVVKDIVATSVDGRILAYDGMTFQKLWQCKLEDTEANSSLAKGKFNKDNTPDFL